MYTPWYTQVVYSLVSLLGTMVGIHPGIYTRVYTPGYTMLTSRPATDLSASDPHVP